MMREQPVQKLVEGTMQMVFGKVKYLVLLEHGYELQIKQQMPKTCSLGKINHSSIPFLLRASSSQNGEHSCSV